MGLKTPKEVALMNVAGQIVAASLRALTQAVQPGVKAYELDLMAQEILRYHHARSSFKNHKGFPASLCVSINEEVVHGIPGNREIQWGDVVSLDFGAIYQGWHSDMAVTVGVGQVTPEVQKLIDVTYGALMAGIDAAMPGKHIGDISSAIQFYIEEAGLSVIKEYMGHEIGREMHEKLRIPNFSNPGEGELLVPGMTFTLEPMVTLGSDKTRVLDDGWTVVTDDGSLAAHFEHTIAITENGAVILTKLP